MGNKRSKPMQTTPPSSPPHSPPRPSKASATTKTSNARQLSSIPSVLKPFNSQAPTPYANSPPVPLSPLPSTENPGKAPYCEVDTVEDSHQHFTELQESSKQVHASKRNDIFPKVRPKVVAIGIQDKTFSDSRMYAHLRAVLLKFADVCYCASAESSINEIRRLNPIGVIIVDAGITQRRELTFVCVDYVRKGGRVVFAANFASYMPPEQDLRRFFSAFSLYWTFSGSKQRGVSIMKADEVVEGDTSVAWWCCPDDIIYKEAQLLGNVKKEHAVYLLQPQDSNHHSATKVNADTNTETDNTDKDGDSTSDNELQSELTKRAGPTRFETPVVWAKQKHGYIGVIGDVNSQLESEALIVAMLGLVRTD